MNITTKNDLSLRNTFVPLFQKGHVGHLGQGGTTRRFTFCDEFLSPTAMGFILHLILGIRSFHSLLPRL